MDIDSDRVIALLAAYEAKTQTPEYWIPIAIERGIWPVKIGTCEVCRDEEALLTEIGFHWVCYSSKDCHHVANRWCDEEYAITQNGKIEQALHAERAMRDETFVAAQQVMDRYRR